MKFLCDNCKAKYQIADEKISGRTLRMKCRRCEHDIIIRGDGGARRPSGPKSRPAPAPVATPAPSAAARARRRGGSSVGPSPVRARKPSTALGADFRRQVGEGRTASAPDQLAVRLDDQRWHVAINDVPVGPIKRDEVARKIAMGAVTGESLAWREGFDDWRPVRDIPELSTLLRQKPAAPPPPPRVAPGALQRSRRPSTRPPTGSRPIAAPSPVTRPVPTPAPVPAASARSNVIPIAPRMGGAAAAFGADDEQTLVSDASAGALAPDDFAPTVPDPSPAKETSATSALADLDLAMGVDDAAADDSAAALPLAAPLAPAAPAPAAAAAAPMVVTLPEKRGLPVGAWIAIVGAASFGVALAVMVGGKILSEEPQAAAPVVEPPPGRSGPSEAEVVIEPAVEPEPEPEPEPDPEAEPEVARPTGPREPAKAGATKAAPSRPGRQLSEEEQARLARFAEADPGMEELPGQIRVGERNSNSGGSSAPTAMTGESLTAQQLSQVVSNNRPALQRCYESAIRGMGAPPTVRINVDVTVGGSGVVTSARATGNSVGDLTRCIESSVRRWRFPASGSTSRTRFPVVFQPAG